MWEERKGSKWCVNKCISITGNCKTSVQDIFQNCVTKMQGSWAFYLPTSTLIALTPWSLNCLVLPNIPGAREERGRRGGRKMKEAVGIYG